jgi:hypothetical protein
MKLAIGLALFTFWAVAQQTGQPPSKKEPSADETGTPDKFRADVLRMLEMDGTKQRVQDGFKQALIDAKAKMAKVCPQCAPEFFDEWARRMESQYTIPQVMDIFARAYQKYLSHEDILQLIALHDELKKDPTASMSPALKEKLVSILPSLMGDMTGGTTQLGAKLGAEIGGEIEREHPEWIKKAPDKR